jgi:hypothetical protein
MTRRGITGRKGIDMAHQQHSLKALGSALAVALCAAVTTAGAAWQEMSGPALGLASTQVSIAGTSNVHAYTASTTNARIVRVKLADDVAGPELWDRVAEPGVIEAFEIAVSAASLTSPRDGLDKNMHKALKVAEHPEILFRLSRLESGGQPGMLKAVGLLTIVGVQREITMDLVVRQEEGGMAVTGDVDLLMTDFGIAPPKAMLGMLKTDPRVTVSFETVLAVPTT